MLRYNKDNKGKSSILIFHTVTADKNLSFRDRLYFPIYNILTSSPDTRGFPLIPEIKIMLQSINNFQTYKILEFQ